MFLFISKLSMKKFYVLIIILAMTATVLTWCNKDSSKKDTSNSSWSTTSGAATTTSCEKTISDYLKSSDKEWTGTVTIKSGDNITVDYVWRLDGENVFDTSVESIAKACGKHNPARNYNEWLAFSVWAWQMIAGFDKAVQWMKIGQTKTIEISPEEAYGQRDPAKLIRVEKNKFPNPESYQAGMEVMTQFWQKFKITEVTDTEIVLDANHELAGKTLIFDITIKSIN